MSNSLYDLNTPRLFKPATIRGIKLGSGRANESSLSDVESTDIESTSSFRYDSPGQGMKSTQQLNIDWDHFENHTFFNSAVSKVNVAFDRIINGFPFDGTRRELETYLDSLTGYEMEILKKFPKNKGYLNFSGSGASAGPDNGTYIKVRDQAGSLFPEFSSLATGEKILDPTTGSFSAEMQLFIPSATNNDQVIFQRMEKRNYGFGLLAFGTSSTSDVALIFSVVSGTSALVASGTISKGSFEHVCVVCDRSEGVNKLRFYINESLAGESDGEIETGKLGFTPDSFFTIGSGSIQYLSGTSSETDSSDWQFTPAETLSGSIDEFRFFHSIRTLEDQKEYAKKSIYASHDLKLYFKFNEPSGSTGVNDIVLDSSGKSLHSRISNYHTAKNDIALRGTSSFYGTEINSPMIYENLDLSPVLFPKLEDITTLNTDLLLSASSYDNDNPNLITKLIPQHYLEEGQEAQGFNTIDGDISSNYSGSSIPGTGDLGSAQILTALLLTYAKQFDEIKLFIDEFSNLTNVDYYENESISDPFLLFAGKYLGIELPRVFNNASILQQVDGENLTLDPSRAGGSLNYVQNQIWRRILTNMREITVSRGTVHSIKSLIRSVGIEPDNILRIREFGGPTSKTLRNLRVKRSEVSSMIDFSGSLSAMDNPTLRASEINKQGFLTGSFKYPRLMSTYLSSSRFEAGYPEPQGTFVNKHIDRTGKDDTRWDHNVHGISNNSDDGLFTSGSWTYEGIYQMPVMITGSHFPTQSLARMHITGTQTLPLQRHAVIFNVVAYSGSSTVELFGRPNWDASSPAIRLVLTGAEIFDGNMWNVSFGRYRADDPVSGTLSPTSGSYFLRCARNGFGELREYHTTASLFDSFQIGTDSQQNISKFYNKSGSFIVIGSQSIRDTDTRFLNSESSLPTSDGWGPARYTNFSGRVGHIRFWSKGLTEEEFKEHTRNFKSLGVEDPKKNFNFDKVATGTWGRLRIDATTDQIVTESNTLGTIDVIDFSQQQEFGKQERPWGIFGPRPALHGTRGDEKRYFNMSGSGFETDKRVIIPSEFHYSHLSPRFDMSETDEKVRVRSYFSSDKVQDSDYAYSAPLFEIPRDDIPDDDTRFAVDFSIAQAVDEDIMTMFSSLDFFDNALGDPNLMFDDFYPDLEQMRKIYFNRLVDKINIKQFFEFFKWFDSMLGIMIEQLIPKKTSFNGVNFVIESHVLERHRMRYLSDEIYLKLSERDPDIVTAIHNLVIASMMADG